MKYLHLSLSADKGGAAISAMRLHESMLDNRMDSVFLSLKAGPDSDKVLPRIIFCIQKLYFLFFRLFQCADKKDSIRSFNVLPTGVSRVLNKYNYDVLVVHWVGAELVSLGELSSLKKRVYVVAHDLWWVGGCSHISEKFQAKNRGVMYCFERYSAKIKRELLMSKNVTVIAPSDWMRQKLLDCYYSDSAQFESPEACRLFPTIPNIIPYSILDCPSTLGRVSCGRTVIILGAADVNSWHKGGDLILAFLTMMNRVDCYVKIFGALDKFINDKALLFENVEVLGELSNKSLISCLSEADIYVSLSRVDNLPNVVLEALAVGCYIVGFKVGGMPNIITNNKLGLDRKSVV